MPNDKKFKSKKMPDYELKSLVIGSGFCEIERKISRTMFKYVYEQDRINVDGEALEPSITEEEYLRAINQKNDIENDAGLKFLFDEARKINHASYSKRNRLSCRIAKMLKNPCVFLTFTFRDDVLDSTSEETRRKYVIRALKQMASVYVANIDYGAKNEREHYHAIVQVDSVSNKLWSYGALNFEKIRSSSDDKILAKYIVKLTNHAIKETTKRCHTIYSRI